MNLEVTSVSRRPERFADTASAIQVITRDDIRRSGAATLVEALRLASNLQVAQANASQWAISARGFDNVLANKLLVMIDGRSIYTPLYAGVFWDAHDVLLEDVERIEVVSGPGGTLWGANAVNGVINIITRSAAETTGAFAAAAAGTELRRSAALRYGDELTPNLAYRVYGKEVARDSTLLPDGRDAEDDWSIGRGGFRLDWDAKRRDVVTLQGDYYDGRPDPEGNRPNKARGGNLLSRWQRELSEGAGFELQVYYDRSLRDFNNGLTEALTTFDVDWQHRLRLGKRQQVVWGLAARRMDHEVHNLPQFGFFPARQTLHIYSAFLQDEITLVPERWRFTLGSKLEHNGYTGLEIQPSLRLSFTPSRQQALWAAVSRAVRTPSRLDTDLRLFAAPTLPLLIGDPDFESEKLLAWEAGWRLLPDPRVSLSVATFYNQYDDLRSAEPGPPPLGLPITLGNGVRGNTYGAEVAAAYQWTARWRLRGGYTWLEKRLDTKPGSRDLNQASAESDDPRHQFLLQTSADLPGRFQLDAVARYVDRLPRNKVPSYFGLDARLAWKATDSLDLEVVGQNLLQDRHNEFVPSSPAAREIQRGVFAKVAWRF